MNVIQPSTNTNIRYNGHGNARMADGRASGRMGRIIAITTANDIT
jgi:hypothetical protein